MYIRRGKIDLGLEDLAMVMGAQIRYNVGKVQIVEGNAKRS